MLSRMADALYWMSRQLERADNTARLIEINLLHLVETEEANFGSAQWEPLLAITGSDRAFRHAEPAREASKAAVVAFLTQVREYPSSVVNCIQNARENARAARDRISSEMWETINGLWLSTDAQLKQTLSPERAPLFYSQLRNTVARFHGQAQDTMMRGEAYGFYRLGTFVERADMTARLLDVKYHILLPSVDMVGSGLDYYQWVALLKSLSAFEAFHRTYQAGLRPVDVAEFVLFSRVFPRSMYHCVERLAQALAHIGFNLDDTEVCQRMNELRHTLEISTAEGVFQSGLHEFLQLLLGQIAALHRALQANCFDAQWGERRALSH